MSHLGRMRAAPFPSFGEMAPIGRGGALIPWGGGTRSAFCPSTGDLVLLTDARFIREPDFYVARIDAFFPGDFLQACGEVFLNSSMAPSRCA